jgi:hypothetical protein
MPPPPGQGFAVRERSEVVEAARLEDFTFSLYQVLSPF